MNHPGFRNIFEYPRDHQVCLRNGRFISIDDLQTDVQKLTSTIQNCPQQNWLLAASDTYHFLCGFLSLLAANREVILPSNNQPGTIEQVMQHADVLLTDLPLSMPKMDILDLLATPALTGFGSDLVIDPDVLYIRLCTSGSTGEPKQIRKSLKTLEQEIGCLESIWGDVVDGRIVTSTVSHQHIYGLLFRLLWPLLSGRCFVCENIEFPEQLDSVIHRHGDCVLVSSPAYLKRMVDVFTDHRFSTTLQPIFSSGGPLSRDTSHAYTDKLGVTPIEVFGSTETGGIAFRQQSMKSDVPWKRLPGVEIRQNCKTFTLEVRSAYCFTSDWFEMGDAVELIDESHFYLKGRVDRIVKLEEKRISLDAMEAKIVNTGLVQEVRVVVLSGHRTILGAVCVPTEVGQRLLEESGKRALSEHIRAHLSGFFDRATLPRKWRFVGDLPYNSQGKLLQATLLHMFDGQTHDRIAPD